MTSPNVTQAMIDAYYEYTHLTLDRGRFVSKLRAFAEPRPVVDLARPLDVSGLREAVEAKQTQ